MPASETNIAPLKGRIALVTGASRGLGAATALALAGQGAHVVMLARTVGALEQLDDRIREVGGSATLIPFDLLKLEEIEGLGPALFKKFGRLDIFIANAAMLGHLGPVAHFDNKVWDRVIALNLTANHRLIRTLDPLLRVGEHGHAVFVTDGSAEAQEAYGGAYAVSKAALGTMVQSYAAETRKTRLRVNLLDPGPMRTMLRAQGYPGENAAGLRDPFAVVPGLLGLLSNADARHGERIRVA